jgi:hypothetical protein
VSGVAPVHWQEAVQQALQRHRVSFDGVWAAVPSMPQAAVAAALLPVVTASAREVLIHLYPDVAHVFE